MNKSLNILDTLNSFTDPDIVLEKVEYAIEWERLRAVRLSFDSGRQMIFGIDEGSDTILALSSLGRGVTLHDVSGRGPWREAMGKHVIWGWELRNSRRYADGVQLQFGAGIIGTTIQLVVVASSFAVYEAKFLESDPFHF